MLNNPENQIANTIVNKDQLCRAEMGTKVENRVCMCWLMGGSLQWLRAMMVQEKDTVEVSVQNWHVSIERTTSLGCRAFRSIGLGIQVTTRRAASHLAWGSRFACFHSTFSGTSGWLTLHPIA